MIDNRSSAWVQLVLVFFEICSNPITARIIYLPLDENATLNSGKNESANQGYLNNK